MRPIIKWKRKEKQRQEMKRKESECEHACMWGKKNSCHLLSTLQSLGPASSLNFSSRGTIYWVGSLFIYNRKNTALYIRLNFTLLIPSLQRVNRNHLTTHPFIHSFIHPCMQWTSNENLLYSGLWAEHFGWCAKMIRTWSQPSRSFQPRGADRYVNGLFTIKWEI